MELVVKLTAEGAEALRLARLVETGQAIRETAARHGAQLRPQGSTAAGRARLYGAQVPDAETGERLVAALEALPGVQAAYVKPDIRPAGGAATASS